MATMTSEDTKRRIRDSNDLVDVVRSYGLELKRAGRNLKACCPFHNEKTASFNVNPEGQYFKCFGCGKGGDVFNFVMFQERVEFPEALRILADRAGIVIETDPKAVDQYQKEKSWKAGLYKINAAAAAFYKERLYANEGKAAREYLTQRGISEEMWERFTLGFAPADGSPLVRRLQSQGAPAKALIAAGLASGRDDGSLRDYFFGRVMFPIADSQGRVIAFGGRVLGDGEPKYLNTRETALFVKNRTVYALDRARDRIVETRQATIVEGYTDVIMCHQHGVENVVACLGTAITVEHVRALRRLADELILLTDSDRAGIQASLRAGEVLWPEDCPARVASLPGDGKDPCDFLLQCGRAPFEAEVAKGVSIFEHKFRQVAALHDLADPSGQAAAARELMRFVSLSPDPLRRAAFRREVAGRLGLPEKDLPLAAARPAPESAPPEEDVQAAADVPAPTDALGNAEREMLRWIFHEPAWMESAAGEIDLTALSGPADRRIGRAILAALDEGLLPPDLAVLGSEGHSPSGAVAKEVLARLTPEGPEGPEILRARNLCVMLAEEGPEHARLKPDEAYALRSEAVRRARVEHELALAKRAEAAARAKGDDAGATEGQARVLELQRALKTFKR